MEKSEDFTDVIRLLHARGFKHFFSLHTNRLHCSKNNISVYPHEFSITALYYFPADAFVAYDRILYTIEVATPCNKGILLITAFDKISVFTEIINRKLQECIDKNRHVFDNGML